jgi:hypothetical protein
MPNRGKKRKWIIFSKKTDTMGVRLIFLSILGKRPKNRMVDKPIQHRLQMVRYHFSSNVNPKRAFSDAMRRQMPASIRWGVRIAMPALDIDIMVKFHDAMSSFSRKKGKINMSVSNKQITAARAKIISIHEVVWVAYR